jgi:hypothetical protein
MKRISVVGMCLFAAFAFSVIAASSASAKKAKTVPNPYKGASYGLCVKVKKGGTYTNATCTEYYATEPKPGEVVLANKGKYNWINADECYPKKKGNFVKSDPMEGGPNLCLEEKKKKGKFELEPSPTYTSTTGRATLVTPEGPLAGEITCEASTDEGQITGATSNVDAVKFTGCETLGQKCENTATLGEIDTFLLRTELEEASSGVAANRFFGTVELEPSEHPGVLYSAEFACENVGYFRTSGSTAGAVTPTNVEGTKSKTDFAKGKYQALVTEYSTTGAAGSWVAPSASEEVVEGEDTTSSPIDTRVGK